MYNKNGTIHVLFLLSNKMIMLKEITKEDIKREYSNKVGVTGKQAAKALSITHKTFKKKLELYNIQFKKRNSKYKNLNDKKWLKEQYFKNKKSVLDIAKEINATSGAVYSAIKWMKVDLRSSEEGLKIKFPNGRYGKNASNWKGGKRKSGEKGQYTMILQHTHPKADPSGYVMEHRLVMEKKIGRYLTKNEIVHHKDGDGHNNKISNLQLTTRKTHFNDHFNAVKEVKRLKKLLDKNNISY